MASNTSNQRHSQGGNAARGKQGSQKENWPSMDTAHEYVESAQEYASDVSEQASEYWSQGREQVRGMVRGREGTTVLVALAAGVGVGLVIGAALSRSHAEQQSCNARRTAEQFGRRLMDRLENMIPDALSEHFSRS
jgi:hypothetical protein